NGNPDTKKRFDAQLYKVVEADNDGSGPVVMSGGVLGGAASTGTAAATATVALAGRDNDFTVTVKPAYRGPDMNGTISIVKSASIAAAGQEKITWNAVDKILVIEIHQDSTASNVIAALGLAKNTDANDRFTFALVIPDPETIA